MSGVTTVLSLFPEPIQHSGAPGVILPKINIDNYQPNQHT